MKTLKNRGDQTGCAGLKWLLTVHDRVSGRPVVIGLFNLKLNIFLANPNDVLGGRKPRVII